MYVEAAGVAHERCRGILTRGSALDRLAHGVLRALVGAALVDALRRAIASAGAEVALAGLAVVVGGAVVADPVDVSASAVSVVAAGQSEGGEEDGA